MSVKKAIQLYVLGLGIALVLVTVLILAQALTPTFYKPQCASNPNNPYMAVCLTWPDEVAH